MTRIEILEELKKLTPTERLAIIEDALHLIGEDLQQAGPPLYPTERERQLAVAAEALLSDYSAGSELTAFKALDSEDFRAAG